MKKENQSGVLFYYPANHVFPGYERLIQDNESAAEIIVNFRIHDLNELEMTARSHCRAVFSCDEGWHFQKPPASAGMNGPQRFRPARKGYAQRRTRCA